MQGKMKDKNNEEIKKKVHPQHYKHPPAITNPQIIFFSLKNGVLESKQLKD